MGRIAYLDAEDPARSGWCRFINHAADSLRACNLECKVDATGAGLVWLQARRDVAAGEELAFDYGSSFRFGWDHEAEDARAAAREGLAPPTPRAGDPHVAAAPPPMRLPVGLRGRVGPTLDEQLLLPVASPVAAAASVCEGLQVV